MSLIFVIYVFLGFYFWGFYVCICLLFECSLNCMLAVCWKIQFSPQFLWIYFFQTFRHKFISDNNTRFPLLRTKISMLIFITIIISICAGKHQIKYVIRSSVLSMMLGPFSNLNCKYASNFTIELIISFIQFISKLAFTKLIPFATLNASNNLELAVKWNVKYIF